MDVDHYQKAVGWCRNLLINDHWSTAWIAGYIRISDFLIDAGYMHSDDPWKLFITRAEEGDREALQAAVAAYATFVSHRLKGT